MTDDTHVTEKVAAEKPAENAAISGSSALPQDELDRLTDDIIAGLKTVYDPEIPVNIVDLGLVYTCAIAPVEGGQKIDITMSMTAPGCGMGDVLKSDIEGKLTGLPEVKEVNVTIVFDPPWSPRLMSEATRLQLGLD